MPALPALLTNRNQPPPTKATQTVSEALPLTPQPSCALAAPNNGSHGLPPNLPATLALPLTRTLLLPLLHLPLLPLPLLLVPHGLRRPRRQRVQAVAVQLHALRALSHAGGARGARAAGDGGELAGREAVLGQRRGGWGRESGNEVLVQAGMGSTGW